MVSEASQKAKCFVNYKDTLRAYTPTKSNGPVLCDMYLQAQPHYIYVNVRENKKKLFVYPPCDLDPLHNLMGSSLAHATPPTAVLGKPAP